MTLPELRKLFSPCRLCLRRCGADREKNKKGACNAGLKPAVYSYSPHHGEEPPLSGSAGSGTIFFTHCNMKCAYCQNYAFSQESDRRESRAKSRGDRRESRAKSRGDRRESRAKSRGDFEEIEIETLERMMLELQRMGCHNINLVSPTHYAYQIVDALEKARKKSLNIPVVYNTGGYDSVELIKLLDGIVDIYLVDMRYAQDEMALKYSLAPGYAENNHLIVKEMFRQAGALKLNDKGIAEKGVIARLLILPNNVSGTIETLRFLKNDVSKDIFLSVMSQYYPTYKAANYPAIARRITENEYREVTDAVEKLGFENGWIQGFHAETERFLGTRIPKGRFDW